MSQLGEGGGEVGGKGGSLLVKAFCFSMLGSVACFSNPDLL